MLVHVHARRRAAGHTCFVTSGPGASICAWGGSKRHGRPEVHRTPKVLVEPTRAQAPRDPGELMVQLRLAAGGEGVLPEGLSCESHGLAKRT